MNIQNKKLHYIKAMEIRGIGPLPHYYEEIFTNLTGLKNIGLRGDKNYLYYSKDGRGTGYYVEHEMQLSAESVLRYFQNQQNREKFFKGIEDVLEKTSRWDERIQALDITKLPDKKVAQLFIDANQLHGDIFTYYVVSQPYRMRLIEDAVKHELSKRVAVSRIDHYMTLLATSEKRTKLSDEEIDWLHLLIKHKKDGEQLNVARLESTHPTFWKAIKRHYNRYKILSLGDGVWDYDIHFFLNKLKADVKRSNADLKKQYKQAKSHSLEVVSERHRLIQELYLDKETVSLLGFLAEVGHTRLMMRIEGWIPHVTTIIKLDEELLKRLKHYSGADLSYMTVEELKILADHWGVVPRPELKRRQGTHNEFLILNDHGAYRLFYGTDAGKKFRQLVPELQHDQTKELTGSTAVLGKIKGTACVYRWGDDITEKMKVIKKHPILIAGQTRPSMMPIIRQAKGIVTDEGGVTSHAAIVSRELGIPSVIGTIHATKVFKDGDVVELDADHGTVRKLS